jgi:hypothetical protein
MEGASSPHFLRSIRSLSHSTVTRSVVVRKCISSLDRAGVSFGVSRPTTERSEMSEEMQFWGVAVERYGQGGYPTNALLESTGSTPESKPFRLYPGFRFYPVFSSRERAERFVRGQWQTLSEEVIEQTVANIRQISRDEIPAEHYVSLDLNYPVTWAKLLAGG